jgi:hypothetical protein
LFSPGATIKDTNQQPGPRLRPIPKGPTAHLRERIMLSSYNFACHEGQGFL